MKQCQEELLRKKNSIIKNLQSTEKSLLDKVNTNPKMWDREGFKCNLKSQMTVVLKADLIVQDRTEQKQFDAQKSTRLTSTPQKSGFCPPPRWKSPPPLPSRRHRYRSSNQQTSNEKGQLKEYLEREEPFYRETGSGSTESHTTGSLAPPVPTYVHQPYNSPYDLIVLDDLN